MSKLLINIPVEASTHKYPSMFPYPLLLLNIKEPNDVLVDLVFETFKKNVEAKKRILDDIIKNINSGDAVQYSQIIVNCGEYAPDGFYSKWIEYFLNNINKSVALMGPYATIFKERIQEIGKKTKLTYTILDTNYNTYNVVIPDEMLAKYPKVGDFPKANMRITLNCPRECAMCPVQLLYTREHKFFDINESIEKVRYYYGKGVRFINFIDDNISANIPMLINFLNRLKAEQLKEMTYSVQEGFELSAFYNEDLCALLKELKFDDIKVGVENIKEDFLIKINKPKRNINDIELAIINLRKYKLKPKFFFLIADFQSKEDILDNLKFFSRLGVDLRVNIIRQYEGMRLPKFEALISQQELKKLKALAYAVAYITTVQKFDIFQDNAWDKYCLAKGYTFRVDKELGILQGKQYFGFKTIKWLTAIEYMLFQKYRTNVSIDYDDKGKKIQVINIGDQKC